MPLARGGFRTARCDQTFEIEVLIEAEARCAGADEVGAVTVQGASAGQA